MSMLNTNISILTDSPLSTRCESCVANWLPCQPFPPKKLIHYLELLREEILDIRLPERIGRYGPRGVKRKMSGYPVRKSRGPTKRRAPQPKHRKITLSEQYWA